MLKSGHGDPTEPGQSQHRGLSDKTSQPWPVTRLVVNGKTVDVTVPADMPLLWALRDALALTGTKFGRGIGQCGACTVHLDGNPVRSCVLPISAVKGEITTIEAVGVWPLCSPRRMLSLRGLRRYPPDGGVVRFRPFPDTAGDLCAC
jgi:hypothetical protein